MKIAKVTGNIVSTIRHEKLCGKALKTVVFLDAALNEIKGEHVALDVAECMVGDVVLVNTECDAAVTMFGEDELVSELTICGIIDKITIEGLVHTPQSIGKSG